MGRWILMGMRRAAVRSRRLSSVASCRSQVAGRGCTSACCSPCSWSQHAKVDNRLSRYRVHFLYRGHTTRNPAAAVPPLTTLPTHQLSSRHDIASRLIPLLPPPHRHRPRHLSGKYWPSNWGNDHLSDHRWGKVNANKLSPSRLERLWPQCIWSLSYFL